MKLNEERIIFLSKQIDQIFVKIKNLDILKKNLKSKISQLNELYKSLIKKNKKNNYMIYSLDSFKFQIKTIEIQLDNISKYNLLLINRIYYDFYRILNFILSYLKPKLPAELLANSKISMDKFPKYDYLDNFKIYPNSIVKYVFDTILECLKLLIEWKKQKSNTLKNYQMKQRTGVDIESILFSYEHDIFEINYKFNFFAKSLNYLVDLHKKYLERSTSMYMELKVQVDNDFQLDDLLFNDKLEKTEEVDELEQDSALEDSPEEKVNKFNLISPNNFKIKDLNVVKTIKTPSNTEEDKKDSTENQPEQTEQKVENQPELITENQPEQKEEQKEEIKQEQKVENTTEQREIEEIKINSSEIRTSENMSEKKNGNEENGGETNS